MYRFMTTVPGWPSRLVCAARIIEVPGVSWCVGLEEETTDDRVQEWQPTAVQKNALLRKATVEQRRHYAMSRMVAKHALTVTALQLPHVNVDINVRGDADPTGRAQLSISHDEGIVSAAVAVDQAVGVDVVAMHRVASLQQRKPQLFRRWLQLQSDGVETPEVDFVSCRWAVRECAVKLRGDGSAFVMSRMCIGTPGLMKALSWPAQSTIGRRFDVLLTAEGASFIYKRPIHEDGAQLPAYLWRNEGKLAVIMLRPPRSAD